jgi:DNA polymerase-3 subunit epsilon
MFKRLHLQSPLAFIDVETTGVNPTTDRVVEIAVLRFAPNAKPVSVIHRINPGAPIPPSATGVHGITDADVADCPPFGHVTGNLVRVLDGCDLAGFGIKRFDLPVLVAEFHRSGIHFPLAGRAVIDVLQLYHLREKRDLQAAYRFYCRRKHEAHRADKDVWATACVLDAMLQKYRDLPRTIRELHRQLTEVDLAGRFRLENGAPVFCFGKHAGRRLKDVAQDDPGYLEWMLSGDFLDDVKRLVREAIGSPAEQS